ncbi:hypothetical protein [Litoreibacter janthinus]|uniref:Uncharacterized protein n=1 Tax=Litoreibacter janthinus TaxID=670154 RepID=A0A1I6FTC6_9RHOB|nr:hypothetical protein [Litoreibacter janthinus]SFR33202.1 hypothetical protein SAMN04488002_0281 [Litoreibacter janthinus]
MQATLYSHRLKTVLQHTVIELGVTLSIDDETAKVSLAEHEATILEAASLLRIKVDFQKSANATTVTFYR